MNAAMTHDRRDPLSEAAGPRASGRQHQRGNSRVALERSYSLRVLRYRLREGSCGAGWARGGDGIERDLEMLEAGTVSLITERRASQPWGLHGGEPGAPGENWLLPGETWLLPGGEEG